MKPVLQALLVADYVIQDAASNKRSVIGIFDKLFFPALQLSSPKAEPDPESDTATVKTIEDIRRVGSPSAYVSMTSVRGTQNFSLRYVYLNDDKALFAMTFQVTCTNPLETVQILVPLPSLPVVGAGIYALELLCDDEPLGAFRISAEEKREPSDDHTI